MASALDPELGFVGDVDTVDPSILGRLLAEDLIPVLSTIGSDAAGQAYNINADTVAGAVGAALGAEKVVYLTDVAGILDGDGELIHQVDADGINAMVADGTVAGGMIPKVSACLHAVRGGVASAHVLDGRLPHVLLLELFTDEGVGTMITERTAMSTLYVDLSAPGRDLRAGPGQRALGPEGKRYLDFLSGLAVTSLGHAHPEVADAIAEQARHAAPRLEPVRHRARSRGGGHPRPPPGRRRQGLLLQLGGGGQRGRHQAGPQVRGPRPPRRGQRLRVVPRPDPATLHATGQPEKHEVFQPLPEGFRHVAWQDLDALEAALDPSVTAVLLEPVQGEGGVNPADTEYFAGVRRLCDERGALFMVDEIQTGLGRTGEWFGFQHFGVQPDVVTMAKALGNGVPIGACWAKADVAAAFVPGDHATTFGGQPLATAAARKVLEVMEREDVPARARDAGKRLGDGPARPTPGRGRPGPRPAPGRRTVGPGRAGGGQGRARRRAGGQRSQPHRRALRPQPPR